MPRRTAATSGSATPSMLRCRIQLLATWQRDPAGVGSTSSPCLRSGGAFVALFFWRALTYRQPIVDLRAYLNRNFVFGSFFTFASPIRVFLQIFIMSNLLGRTP
jgi:hypothetical protein